MNGLEQLTAINLITVLIAATFIVSVIQGLYRGASSSARHLAVMVTEGVVILISLYAAWQLASWLSPRFQAWLVGLGLQIPQRELGFWEQIYYTVITGVRDFSLLRFSVLFVLGYGIAKQLVCLIIDPLANLWMSERRRLGPEGDARTAPTLFSSLIGSIIGAVTGLGRSLLMIAAFFIVTTLFPQTPISGYIQDSLLYQKGAKEVIQPVTGDFFSSRLPVFTRAVEEEFTNILQRKYELVDAAVPNDIAEAARHVTANAKTDEEKAKLLYRWVGTRIKYDWDKVRLYEERRIWKEQTPADTFSTRRGVCIDFSRLYAVMARSVGLDVKVVTGLGYDGRGGYGPHAWNEVFLSEKKEWVPLDSTWVASGGNWFNPPNFHETHIKDS
ncbi:MULTISPECIES: transglutaminase domain-containing protein [Paenibacillus]|uniref:transglutaminase domain-containing protein n=1 Tax=Paenibacillus TaxID=44249 RepID=UPI000886C766|nr:MULTISPECIES: transglutaminase domain-containing protein [Paenibacillus]GCL70702.1 cysteine protease [Paenibacillus naphthalenovorans]SDI25656.1 Transglutaminase-like superfamily protein [Paenibacillus naphthalenovorans]